MRIFNWVAIIFFGFSISIAIVLGMLSRDYEFVPERQISESSSQTGQIELSKEMIGKLWRTSGNLDPGNVEIQVIFLNPIQKSDDEKLIFQITLNTLSINLAGYDITKKVVFEDSSGRTVTDGFYWKPVHNDKDLHLIGILIVPIQAKGEKNEFSSTPDTVEWIKLTIKGVPQIEIREFLWDTELS